MSDIIALETEAQSIGNGSGAISKKYCTKSRAEELKCIVNGNYTNNQLVAKKDLQAKGNMWSVKASIRCIGRRSLQSPFTSALFNVLFRVDYYYPTSEDNHLEEIEYVSPSYVIGESFDVTGSAEWLGDCIDEPSADFLYLTTDAGTKITWNTDDTDNIQWVTDENTRTISCNIIIHDIVY